MGSLSISSANSLARDRMIAYAQRVYAYKLTAAEADEIRHAGYWRDVDDFVTYMRQFARGSSDEVEATADVVVPGMRLYTDSEVDAMEEDELDEVESGRCGRVGSRWTVSERRRRSGCCCCGCGCCESQQVSSDDDEWWCFDDYAYEDDDCVYEDNDDDAVEIEIDLASGDDQVEGSAAVPDDEPLPLYDPARPPSYDLLPPPYEPSPPLPVGGGGAPIPVEEEEAAEAEEEEEEEEEDDRRPRGTVAAAAALADVADVETEQPPTTLPMSEAAAAPLPGRPPRGLPRGPAHVARRLAKNIKAPRLAGRRLLAKARELRGAWSAKLLTRRRGAAR